MNLDSDVYCPICHRTPCQCQRCGKCGRLNCSCKAQTVRIPKHSGQNPQFPTLTNSPQEIPLKIVIPFKGRWVEVNVVSIENKIIEFKSPINPSINGSVSFTSQHTLFVGKRLDVRDRGGKWITGSIVELSLTAAKVSFDYPYNNPKYDEVIPLDSKPYRFGILGFYSIKKKDHAFKDSDIVVVEINGVSYVGHILKVDGNQLYIEMTDGAHWFHTDEYKISLFQDRNIIPPPPPPPKNEEFGKSINEYSPDEGVEFQITLGEWIPAQVVNLTPPNTLSVAYQSSKTGKLNELFVRKINIKTDSHLIRKLSDNNLTHVSPSLIVMTIPKVEYDVNFNPIPQKSATLSSPVTQDSESKKTNSSQKTPQKSATLSTPVKITPSQHVKGISNLSGTPKNSILVFTPSANTGPHQRDSSTAALASLISAAEIVSSDVKVCGKVEKRDSFQNTPPLVKVTSPSQVQPKADILNAPSSCSVISITESLPSLKLDPISHSFHPEIGDMYDIMDKIGKWYVGEVIKCDNKAMIIRFPSPYNSEKFDEVYDYFQDAHRISEVGTYTSGLVSGTYQANQSCWILPPLVTSFILGTVCAIEGKQITVSFFHDNQLCRYWLLVHLFLLILPRFHEDSSFIHFSKSKPDFASLSNFIKSDNASIQVDNLQCSVGQVIETCSWDGDFWQPAIIIQIRNHFHKFIRVMYETSRLKMFDTFVIPDNKNRIRLLGVSIPKSVAEIEKEEKMKKFSSKLDRFGMKMVLIKNDGQCFYRAVAHQLFGDEDKFQRVRADCHQYMMDHKDYFSAFFQSEKEFMDRIIRTDLWGDEYEIVAVGKYYEIPVQIFYLEKEIPPISEADLVTPKIRILYTGSHYNSIVVLKNPPPLYVETNSILP